MRIDISEKYQVYSNNEKEIYIQAEIYHQCRINNISCFLELSISEVGRLDTLLNINGKYLIIECKQNSGRKLSRNTAQIKKYRKLKIPIIIINDIGHVKEVINLALKNDLKVAVYTYKSLKRTIKKDIYEQREKEVSKDNSYSNRTGNVEVSTQDFV